MNASLNLLAEWATNARPLWASIAAEVTAYLDDKDAFLPAGQDALFEEHPT